MKPDPDCGATGEPPERAPREAGPDLVDRPLPQGSLYREHRHVVRVLASLRVVRGYRVTVKPIRRSAPREARLLPARTSITYDPGRSFDSRLRLRSVTR